MTQAICVRKNVSYQEKLWRGFYYNCLARFAISIALRAQSYPLFPAFVPALSIACSILSVVTTPKSTGTPDSRDTLAIPFAASLHTRS